MGRGILQLFALVIGTGYHLTIMHDHTANGHIAVFLGQKLRWDPDAERFLDNDAANKLIDKPILDRTLDQLQQRRNRFFIEGDPEAILIIEFFCDSEEEVAQKKAAVTAAMTEGGKSYHCAEIAADRVHQVWALRKAGLGLLMVIRGDFKPVAFV